MFSRRMLALSLGCLLTLTLSSTVNAQVVRGATGSFTTNLRQGAIKFTTVKATRVVNRVIYQGNFVIAGKSYPGAIYPIPNGTWGMVWYYGASGLLNGQAVLSPTQSNSLSGSIEFYNRNGVVTESGTATVTLRY